MSALEESVYIADFPGQGLGVCAGRFFAAGEYVLTFQGRLLLKDQIRDFTHCLEVAAGVFLGPSGGADDHVNHSCNPNCAVFFEGNRPTLRTLVDIRQDEQFTFDYSTIMFTDPSSFDCRCGQRNCRGRIGSFLSLPNATRRRYVALSLVPEFVLMAARIRRRRRRPGSPGQAVLDGV